MTGRVGPVNVPALSKRAKRESPRHMSARTIECMAQTPIQIAATQGLGFLCWDTRRRRSSSYVELEACRSCLQIRC